MPIALEKRAVRSKKREPRRRTRTRHATPGDHSRGLLAVADCLRREMERIGEYSTPPVDGRLSWRDIVPVPVESGTQCQREFFGRTACIIDAVVLVEHTCDILYGPMPEEIRRLKVARTAIAELLSFSTKHGAEIAAAVHNGDLLRQRNVAFGAQPREVHEKHRFTSSSADNAMRANVRAAARLDRLIAVLEARLPDVLTAGFYAPGGTGPLGHFVMLLRELGLEPPEITEILGRVPERKRFDYEASWINHRAAAIGNTKQLANRARRKLSRAVGSETVAAAKGVPPSTRGCVIVQLNAGSDQHFTGYVATHQTQIGESSAATSGAGSD